MDDVDARRPPRVAACCCRRRDGGDSGDCGGRGVSAAAMLLWLY